MWKICYCFPMNNRPEQFTFEDAELIHASAYLKNRRNDNLEFATLNKKFGNLTVLPYVGWRQGRKELFVLTRCDCGKEVLQMPHTLQAGKVESCGCSRYQKHDYYNQTRPDGNRLFKYGSRHHYGNSKRDAEKRGVAFDLSYEDFALLVSQQCFYCFNNATGLDRLDSDKGYELENVVPCCKQCNRMKHTMTQHEFLETVKQIYLKQFLGQGNK
jgi:hypothetical protein